MAVLHEMNRELTAEIQRLCRERNAIILAHNYQRAEMQEIADYVGDSLELSIKASRLAGGGRGGLLQRGLHGGDGEAAGAGETGAAAGRRRRDARWRIWSPRRRCAR